MTADIAAPFLGRWAEIEELRAPPALMTHSENHVFRLEAAAGTFVLRVHRRGYNSEPAIRSELEWLRALGRDTGLSVPPPVPGRDGALVQRVDGRHAVLFRYLPGVVAEDVSDPGPLFPTIGRFAALAHGHVAAWPLPAGFTRPVWDDAGILDPSGVWGDWRNGPGVAGAVHAALSALDVRLRSDLSAHGRGADRFGPIHADMRLANLLVDGAEVHLIDFDDCGIGWFGYDFGAAVSFIDDADQIAALKARWVAGYCAIRPLPGNDLAILDAFVLLRRMALIAWCGSHGETDLARAQAPTIAAVTARMAERYLARG